LIYFRAKFFDISTQNLTVSISSCDFIDSLSVGAI
jgi:hypothetical protein